MLVNLHSHLEGRIRPATATELAGALGVPEPAGGWATALQLDGPADLTTFLAKVAASYPFFATGEYVARLASEAVQDAAADGVDYLEVRFGPATHTRPGFSLDDVVRAVCAGLADGTARTGVPAGAVVCALRHHDADVNDAVARAAARAAGSGVVGFDLAGDELRFPALEPYVSAFGIAGAAGLGLTCHAAEAASATAAQQAVRLLGVTRIGHGVHVAGAPDVLGWCGDEGVVVECCPTSNWFTGGVARLADHPIRTFRDHGVAVVLGDDNPRQTRSPMSAEHRLLTTELGLTADDVRALDETSVAAAFVDDGTRAALRRSLSARS